jgi:hypothetical protein
MSTVADWRHTQGCQSDDFVTRSGVRKKSSGARFFIWLHVEILVFSIKMVTDLMPRVSKSWRVFEDIIRYPVMGTRRRLFKGRTISYVINFVNNHLHLIF